ncbi:MAG: hypothetical protein LUB59_06175 [Candidatus Gastranaerophilales bacterium]|nr:hypothetical protein [Candidatus Gastranaerophilales bacterium]
MKKQLSILLLLTIICTGVNATEYICPSGAITTAVIAATTTAPPAKTKPITTAPTDVKTGVPAKEQTHTVPLTNLVNPIDVVKRPTAYMGKKINVSARFDKFATLGLDYKPAMRSSETYISFLIMRTDTDKNIPLSEMKLFIKRTAAEKLIDLKEGDKVQFTGTVFSTALGDPWIDVEKLEKIK